MYEAKKRDYHGRNLCLGDAFAWFGIDFAAAKRKDSPVWLCFRDSVSVSSVSVKSEEVRSRLGSLAEPGLEWRSEGVCVPIVLPAVDDREAVLKAMVVQLTCIAERIDPKGLTYRDTW